ncbi:hypothetical protein M5689_007247 [Euphorbia peplus]|nr:hypothetical protein M5689_007247 [Euphorbia peplus]
MADLQSLFKSLDPISLILSQNSLHSDKPLPLTLSSDSYIMERGPRYRAYAELRDSKLRIKNLQTQIVVSDFKQTPPKKQVKFQTSVTTTTSRKGYSVLAQSVPDFSATLRKENRKPPMSRELTPPSKNWGGLSGSRGSKSASSAGEKRGGVARKSYANVEELKGLTMAASAAINGDYRARRGITRSKTVLGYRQL